MPIPSLYGIGLILTEIPWYILFCIPYWKNLRVKKQILAISFLGLALLRGLIGYVSIVYFANWRAIDTNYYYVHTLILLSVARICFRVHIAKLFYTEMLLWSVSTGVLITSARVVKIIFQIPDGMTISGATMPSYTLTVLCAIALCFPFIYRFFKVQLRQVFDELPIKDIWLLSLMPVLFFVIRQVYIEMIGSAMSTNPALPLINLLIVLTGLISFYINVHTVLNTLGHKRTEKELAEQNRMLDSLYRMKSDLLANIGHELITPLTIISGYAQQTRREIENGHMHNGTTQNLIFISHEAHRLAELADQILYTSKNEQTGVTMNPVEPAKILERAAALSEPILAKRGNRLERMAELNCPPVLANFDMIVQILLNLCVNANRHTEDGLIVMSVQRRGDTAEFKVEDNGEGIAAEILAHVFERGFSHDGKTGLGLAICKDIVNQHGGEIKLDNNPGGGACATFTLLLVDQADDLASKRDKNGE